MWTWDYSPYLYLVILERPINRRIFSKFCPIHRYSISTLVGQIIYITFNPQIAVAQDCKGSRIVSPHILASPYSLLLIIGQWNLHKLFPFYTICLLQISGHDAKSQKTIEFKKCRGKCGRNHKMISKVKKTFAPSSRCFGLYKTSSFTYHTEGGTVFISITPSAHPGGPGTIIPKNSLAMGACLWGPSDQEMFSYKHLSSATH